VPNKQLIYDEYWSIPSPNTEMPTHKVEVNEYECIRCGYRWTNRVNGKEGERPKRCGKCKRWGWDEGPIRDEEKKLRRKLLGLETEKANKKFGKRRGDLPWKHLLSQSEQQVIIKGNRPNNLCWVFLYKIRPRPSIKELELVIAQMNDRYRHELMENVIGGRTKNKD
jgi:hypothetical protein